MNQTGADEVPEPYATIIARLGPLSPEYKRECAVFLAIELILWIIAIFHVQREFRYRAQFAALFVFIHRMLACGILLHIVELSLNLNSTYGVLTGVLGTIASNFKQLPAIACLFYFIGVTFEVYQREFLPGRTQSIRLAWRVLIAMILGFMIAIIISLILMFAFNERRYNVITTIWEGICFVITLLVVVGATYRLQLAAVHREATTRRTSAAYQGNPMKPLLRKVVVISIILVGCFLASVFGAYSVFVKHTTFGGSKYTIETNPLPSYTYWDLLALDIMYIVIHAVVTALAWKAPRPTRVDSEKSVSWDRKSSASSKNRMPMQTLSLHTQNSQDSSNRSPASPQGGGSTPPSPIPLRIAEE